jgi:hypothetical protein
LFVVMGRALSGRLHNAADQVSNRARHRLDACKPTKLDSGFISPPACFSP